MSFPVVGIVVASVIALFTFLNRILRTTSGDKLLARLCNKAPRASRLREIVPARVAPAPPAALPFHSPSTDPLILAMALHGPSVLSQTPLAPLHRSLYPVTDDGGRTSSDSGSSDSGGECSDGGSSCSGCGGGGDQVTGKW